MPFDRKVITDPTRVAAAREAMKFIIPPDEDLQRYCQEAANVTKAGMAFVTLVFADSHHVVADYGFPEGDLVFPGERDGTFARTGCAYVVAASQPLHFSDTHNFDLLKECLAFREIRSFTAAPMFFQGQTVGSVGVCDLRPREITRKELDKLVAIADEVSSELKARDVHQEPV